jgi:transposase
MAGSPHGHQRHLVETAHGSALAGSARAVWALADLCGSTLPVATRGSVGSYPHPRPDQIGCRGRGSLGGQPRQFDSARSSARQWRSSSAQSRRREKGICHPSDEGLGRSRGGLTTKFHLACDGRGRPLSIVITPGHRHDSTQLEAVLDGIRVPRAPERGRPRTRPDHLIADKGYSYPRCRRVLRKRQIKHTIPERRDQRATSGSARTTAPLRSHDLRAAHVD